MTLETRKVLDMLAEGKVTPADAEKLLNKLQNSDSPTTTETAPTPSARAARSLRIAIDEPGRKPVNIRMPLSFLRTGSAIIGMLPKQVNERLSERGIDLSVLSGKNGDELNKILQELQLEIDKGDGKKVRIFCE